MLFTRRDLVNLIIPLIMEQFLAIAIGAADTMMVASVGEAAVSSVSLVDSINILLINIFSALATGGAVIATQYLGKRDVDAACSSAKQLVYTVLFLSGAVTALALIFRVPILRLIFGKIEKNVMDGAQIYFLYTALSYPFLAVYNAGAALYRAMGNSKISMLTSLFMNGLNIIGNAILIFIFHLGVAGAAIATLVSRIIGAVLMTVLVCDKRNPIHVEKLFRVRVDFKMIRDILHIGIPNGLENGMFQLGRILTQSLVATFGTAALAANAVGNSLASFQTLPGNAISLAMITVVGRCVGARENEQAKKYTYKLMAVAHLSMLAAVVLTMALIHPLIGLFNLSEDAASITFRLMVWYSVSCVIIWPPSFVLPNAFRAASDVRSPMIISILSMWICRIALSYVIGGWLGLGVEGVWMAMIADWVVRSVFFIVHFFRGKWLTKYNAGKSTDAA